MSAGDAITPVREILGFRLPIFSPYALISMLNKSFSLRAIILTLPEVLRGMAGNAEDIQAGRKDSDINGATFRKYPSTQC